MDSNSDRNDLDLRSDPMLQGWVRWKIGKEGWRQEGIMRRDQFVSCIYIIKKKIKNVYFFYILYLSVIRGLSNQNCESINFLHHPFFLVRISSNYGIFNPKNLYRMNERSMPASLLTLGKVLMKLR